jgi:signal transduction histidine kinase
VHDAVESVVDAVEPLATDKGLTIDFQSLEQSAFAAGGHRIFTRIIHHLLDNAVKFTEAGAIKVRVSEEDEEVSVVVSDTGIGIRPEFIPHIFDEFSQESTGLERTHQGSGLGLAVSQRLALAIGGRIEVASEKGKGSTFRLHLPRAAVAVSR